MSTLQSCDNIILTESEEQKQARLNRLRAAEIKRRLKAIDGERIRPLAAIVADKATTYDVEKLEELEAEAQSLRAELAQLEV